MSQEPTIYAVNELNRYLKKTIEKDSLLQEVWIRGEISNFTSHSSGHMYFSLKENGSVIKAVMFAGNNRTLKFKPKEGTKVVAKGAITVYEPNGTYQVNIKEMQPDGVGNLYLAFNQLKEKLEKEGLFDQERKREIPPFPKTIGLITSPTGAAVRDMITTIKRRYPIAKIQLFPVLVQGEQAPLSVINGIEKMNEKGDADVLIVGRGGGSIEDLWAFNDEGVARAIFSSKIPLISAVGHETDFTIADFVADMRAPTPTGAAELATPVPLSELERTFSDYQAKMERTLHNKMGLLFERLKRNEKTLDFFHPKKQLEEQSQRLDQLTDRMSSIVKQKVKDGQIRFSHITQRLELSSPKKRIEQAKEDLSQKVDMLHLKTGQVLKEKEHALMVLVSKLDSLSPLKTLTRGYSVAYHEGKTITSAKDLKEHDEIDIKLTDALVTCEIKTIKEEK